MQELQFPSTTQAIQYLANFTGKRVKVAKVDRNDLDAIIKLTSPGTGMTQEELNRIKDLTLRGNELKIELETEGYETERELMQLHFDEEFGMLSQNNEIRIQAEKNLQRELTLIRKMESKDIDREQENSIIRFANMWGGMLNTAASMHGNFVENVIAQFRDMLARMAIMAGVYSIGGMIFDGGMMSGLKAFAGQMGFRQSGGPVMAGYPYMVGERGPELFIPKNTGTIIPNKTIYNSSLSISFSGADKNAMMNESDQALAMRIKRVIRDKHLN